MNALNESFYIIRVILFCLLIEVNCRLYMSPDKILQVRKILEYMYVMGKNIICMIIQAWTTFTKTGTYGY